MLAEYVGELRPALYRSDPVYGFEITPLDKFLEELEVTLGSGEGGDDADDEGGSEDMDVEEDESSYAAVSGGSSEDGSDEEKIEMGVEGYGAMGGIW